MKFRGIIIGSGALTALLVSTHLNSSCNHPTVSHKDPIVQNQNIKEVPPVQEDTIQFEETPMFPAVLVKENGKSTPIQLNELKIDVNVVGHIATTTFEMTFYNDLDRILEGQLYFPLGENKTVSRFAMDVNGELREGVIVEKEKGRVAFENTTRRRIDPGLLEWTKGNNFKARVYPIPAKGTKKIVFAYEQELLSGPNGMTYVMPLGIEQMVKKFDLNVEVFQQASKPQTTKNQFQNLQFEQWQENFVAKKSFTNYKPNKQLGFSIPQNKVEQVVSEKIDGINYFFASVKPKRFELDKKNPSSISVIWDVSNSGKERNHAKEIALLEAYLKNKNITVELITFSNTAHSKESFTDFNSLKSRLQELDYDGGTQLSSIDFNSIQSEEIFLFSDGISNFGKTEIQVGKKPIHTITSSNKSDFSALKFMSLSSGGSFINLNTSGNQNALSLLSSSPYRLIGYEVLEGNATEIYPKTAIINNKDLVIAGQLYSGKAKVKLNFGFGSTIHHSEIVEIKGTSEALNGSARRLWAQKKLAHIDLKPEENADLITEHGKKYSLVTRNTSLIVLDRLQDYVQHEIVPPPSLQPQYWEIVNRQRKDYTDKENQHMITVKRNWEERLNWLAKEFKAPIEKKVYERYRSSNGSDIMVDSAVAVSDSAPATTEAATPAREEERRMAERDVSRRLESRRMEAEHQAMDVAEQELIAADDDREMEVEELSNLSITAANRSDRLAKAKNDVNGIRIKKNTIKIKEWSPNEPYLGAFRDDNDKMWWDTYIEQKSEYGTAPSYFVDISALFFKKGKKEEALRILSNLAELELENHQILRILGYRLMDIKAFDLAVDVFEEVEKIRGEEPQTYRDLGLAYEQNKQYQKAIESLYKVVTTAWNGRFPNIEQIALVEMNSIITRHKNEVKTEFIDTEFIKDFQTDVRVILNWDSDACDMDLWVIDPRGEKCFYSHNRTQIGGRMSNDFTQGYGPEEFLLKNAISGKYKIKANYYGTRSQKLLAPVTLKMQFFTGYGTDAQKLKEVTLRLKQAKEVVKIAEIEF